MKRVALLHNLFRGLSEHEVEFDLPMTIDALRQSIEKENQCILLEADAEFRWLDSLRYINPDIVFNVAEGFYGGSREAVYPALLEQMKYKYTGPGPTELFVAHDKRLTKMLLRSINIQMPWELIIDDDLSIDRLDRQSCEFDYPLIVKFNTEGSSLGMDEGCIVGDKRRLLGQLRSVYGKYGKPMLVEKYIPGRDISMTFIEGMGIMGPVEYKYQNSTIYNFRLKSVDNDTVWVGVAEDIVGKIKDRLYSISQTIVDWLDIHGYCRIDYRLEDSGSINFLEVNGQVCFHPDGAFVRAGETRGVNYDEIICHIIKFMYDNPRKSCIIGKTDYEKQE
jgi:D-alanine--D-alanine ligase